MIEMVIAAHGGFGKELLNSVSLVVGGIPTDAGKALVYSSIYMSASEYEKLEKISDTGIQVILQSTPDDSYAELSKIKEKL